MSAILLCGKSYGRSFGRLRISAAQACCSVVLGHSCHTMHVTHFGVTFDYRLKRQPKIAPIGAAAGLRTLGLSRVRSHLSRPTGLIFVEPVLPVARGQPASTMAGPEEPRR